MPPPLPSSRQRASVFRRILGSIMAAFVGWIALMLSIWVGIRYALGWTGVFKGAPLEILWLLAFYTGLAAASAWLFLILPIYLLAPPGLIFWRWPIATLVGLLGGLLVAGVVSGAALVSDGIVAGLFLAGLPGALTGLFAGLSAERYLYAPGEPAFAGR